MEYAKPPHGMFDLYHTDGRVRASRRYYYGQLIGSRPDVRCRRLGGTVESHPWIEKGGESCLH